MNIYVATVHQTHPQHMKVCVSRLISPDCCHEYLFYCTSQTHPQDMKVYVSKLISPDCRHEYLLLLLYISNSSSGYESICVETHIYWSL